MDIDTMTDLEMLILSLYAIDIDDVPSEKLVGMGFEPDHTGKVYVKQYGEFSMGYKVVRDDLYKFTGIMRYNPEY